MIHTCTSCGQRNRVPEKYKGVPVCARCKTQVFPTEMRAGPRKRSRWSRRDWHLAIPVLMLAIPIHWVLNHDWSWFWDKTIDWVTTISVNLTILTAIALSWLGIGLGSKFIWEETWAVMRQRRRHPPRDEDPMLDIGPWEAAQDYINLARQKWQRFALRKEHP